jgi:hypothetical protein
MYQRGRGQELADPELCYDDYHVGGGDPGSTRP